MQPTVGPGVGFGHLDSLVDEIKKKESDRVKLASQLRQQRLRADVEAAGASQLKSELEKAGVDRMSLKKEIGLLSRQNEDLAMENAKLMGEKCDFQRSMANNEAKLKQNEVDLTATQRGFVETLEKINTAFSRHRASMTAQSGRGGAVRAEIPSPEELDALKAAAAKVQEATLRAAEFETRLHAVEAESQALKGEAAESAQKEESLRQEVASLKDALKSARYKTSDGGQAKGRAQLQRQQQQHEQLSKTQHEVARLEEVCSKQVKYILEMEAYANTVEDTNLKLNKQLDRCECGPSRESDGEDDGEDEDRFGAAAGAAAAPGELPAARIRIK